MLERRAGNAECCRPLQSRSFPLLLHWQTAQNSSSSAPCDVLSGAVESQILSLRRGLHRSLGVSAYLTPSFAWHHGEQAQTSMKRIVEPQESKRNSLVPCFRVVPEGPVWMQDNVLPHEAQTYHAYPSQPLKNISKQDPLKPQYQSGGNITHPKGQPRCQQPPPPF